MYTARHGWVDGEGHTLGTCRGVLGAPRRAPWPRARATHLRDGGDRSPPLRCAPPATRTSVAPQPTAAWGGHGSVEATHSRRGAPRAGDGRAQEIHATPAEGVWRFVNAVGKTCDATGGVCSRRHRRDADVGPRGWRVSPVAGEAPVSFARRDGARAVSSGARGDVGRFRRCAHGPLHPADVVSSPRVGSPCVTGRNLGVCRAWRRRTDTSRAAALCVVQRHLRAVLCVLPTYPPQIPSSLHARCLRMESHAQHTRNEWLSFDPALPLRAHAHAPNRSCSCQGLADLRLSGWRGGRSGDFARSHASTASFHSAAVESSRFARGFQVGGSVA